ncbi:AAA family ATPase [Rhizobium sp. CNPSo 3464]|uniref:AAA family ATPase n=1 Tax=Rhizobium sp. CNPSo 3464 TaxID=3021406 RepID=UPI002549DF30|nr:AAA family ATPase [Rhizobium sp. CNPSo 3464]MDK4741863.1 AAA family ATPase [Rhizobium sp. CNPSo 3464]
MRLLELSYTEFLDEPRYWRLHPVSFQQINLIVGRNASGKSRTLSVIHSLAKALTGTPTPPPAGNFDVKFSNDEGIWHYRLEVDDEGVQLEIFAKDNEILLERGKGGVGTIHATELKQSISFQSPIGMLAATSRNDQIQHPFLLPLIEWANETYFYPCHTELGKGAIMLVRPNSPPLDPKDFNQTVGVLREGLSKNALSFAKAVLSDMRTVGYDLEAIWLGAPANIIAHGYEVQSICVKERGITGDVDQFMMSVGMFRALAIVIHLNYGLYIGEAQTVLIDDIGEGLDFDRSSNLIRLLVSKVKNSDMQIIMTTNDRYVMNGIDLQYWTVLDRDGPEVRAYNEKNRPEEFEEFRFTGLNNFDFLARDFLATPTKK